MARRRPVLEVPPAHAMPVFNLADALAAKAFVVGTADAEQQKRLCQFLLRDICGLGGISYVPGDPNATAFKEGRRFVGAVLNEMITIPPEKLRRKTDVQASDGSMGS